MVAAAEGDYASAAEAAQVAIAMATQDANECERAGSCRSDGARAREILNLLSIFAPGPGPAKVRFTLAAVTKALSKAQRLWGAKRGKQGSSDDDDGIVYLRVDREGGKSYVGQSKGAKRFDKRQVEHGRNNPMSDFEYVILGRAKPGDGLDRLEEFFIRAFGGPTTKRNPTGPLANRRHQMSERRYSGQGR